MLVSSQCPVENRKWTHNTIRSHVMKWHPVQVGGLGRLLEELLIEKVFTLGSFSLSGQLLASPSMCRPGHWGCTGGLSSAGLHASWWRQTTRWSSHSKEAHYTVFWEKFCFSHFSFSLKYYHSWQFSHHMCGGFLHTKQFCDPRWMSYNLTQFYLPGDSVRSHRLGVSPTRRQLQVVGPQVTHNFCPMWLQIRGSQDPHSGWISLLERLTELRETHSQFNY